uniref:Putative secreted protein n=1 Tax=Anopheles darlingi TaxID=43151 RepID=A0A2M4D7Q1_ANODA
MGGRSFIVTIRSSSLLFFASGNPGSPPWSPPLPEEGDAGSEPPEEDDEVDTDTDHLLIQNQHQSLLPASPAWV